MAKSRKQIRKTSRQRADVQNTEPKYPYTLTPGALRRFLKLVPEKPKPARVNGQLLKSWGIGDTNAGTIIRVLKRLDLVGANNEPTPTYDTFMHAQTGPALLGRKLREIYPEIFEASTSPVKEDDATLRRLFNIHAGGAEKTIQLQLQTFKALGEHATFDSVATPMTNSGAAASPDVIRTGNAAVGNPTIHIDLHIHLPPDKSSRDYQAIFEDIGRYLLGRGETKQGS